jgi:hypothetical protein
MEAATGRENPRQRQPNWVDKWTFYFSVLGVVAVCFYGYQAWVANGLTRRLIGENSRPFIQIDVAAEQQVKQITRIIAPETTISTIGVEFTLANIGKLPGKGILQSIIAWSPTPLSEPPDISRAEAHEVFVWPNVGDFPRIAYGVDNMTDGQYSDLRKGTGYIYFRARLIYGEAQEYSTSVCWQISLTRANDDIANPMMAKLNEFTLWEREITNPCPTTAN